jgi:hypothetical protein
LPSPRLTSYIPSYGGPEIDIALARGELDAMRKALNDPDFHRDFKKLSGFDASPLMPEEQEKVVRELPRERSVVEFFKKLSGGDPLPAR